MLITVTVGKILIPSAALELHSEIKVGEGEGNRETQTIHLLCMQIELLPVSCGHP